MHTDWIVGSISTLNLIIGMKVIVRQSCIDITTQHYV